MTSSKNIYEEALAHPQVTGIVVGTRPDCVSDELLDYFKTLSERYYVMIEYGIESTNDKTLRFINRGHDYSCAEKAIRDTARGGIHTGAHLILGLPHEDKETILSHAGTISKLLLTTLKLHQLQLIKAATLMILDEICARTCKFCNALSGRPLPLDVSEAEKVADSVRLMKLRHAVITSVDRDDLPDRSANQWARTIRAIKRVNPNTTLEVLISDFDGKPELIQLIIDEKPEVISHNLETVRRLTPFIRSRSRYERSLSVLEYIAKHHGKAMTGHCRARCRSFSFR